MMKLRLKKIKIKSYVHSELHHMWRMTADLAPRKILPFKRYQREVNRKGCCYLKSAATTQNSTRLLKKLKTKN